MNKYLIVFCSLIYCFTWSVQAQIPGASVLSNVPPSIKWQQINSPHFRVIFPKGAEEMAQKSANVLEHIYEPASRTLGIQPRKFNIVLQNQLVESNGFVTVGPFRSELFTMPPQSHLAVGNDRWLERLIAHEYRHIVQFETAVTPFNKMLYFLFGEISPASMVGLAGPAWFFEGDAVGLETAMGHSGRGRTPHFLMGYKANLIEKGGFNYYKQYLRSFRDFVPSHYPTGYIMTTHMKNEYGADVMGKISKNAFRKPFIPFTFSNSIKKIHW